MVAAKRVVEQVGEDNGHIKKAEHRSVLLLNIAPNIMPQSSGIYLLVAGFFTL